MRTQSLPYGSLAILDRQQPQARNLIRWWPFIPQKTSVLWERASILSYNATPVNYASTVNSNLNWKIENGVGYFKFDDPSDQYAQIPTSADQRHAGSLTCTYWVEVFNLQALGINRNVLNCGGDGELEAANYQYQFGLRNVGGILTPFSFHENGAGVNNLLEGTQALTIKQNYHIAHVRDNVAKTYTHYVNGILSNSGSYANNPTGGSTTNAYIGAGADSAASYMDGFVGDLRLYDAALDAGQILDIYQNPTALWKRKKKIFFVEELTPGTTYDKSLTVAGTASVVSLENIATLTTGATAAVARSATLEINPTRTAAATAAVTAVGGITREDFQNPSAIAGIDFIVGFTYDDVLTVAAIAGSQSSDNVDIGNALSLDTTATVDATDILHPGLLGTVSGTAGVAVESTGDFYETITLTVIALAEPIDNAILLLPATADISVTHDYVIDVFLNLAATAGVTRGIDGSTSVSVAQTLVFGEANRGLPSLINISESLELSQTALANTVKHIEVVQTLVFAQEALRIYPVDQTLILTQEVVAQKIITVDIAQSLLLTHTANRNAIYVQSITQLLEFKLGKTFPLPLNGTPIFIPGANYELVPRKCFFRLYSTARTILLPCPLFGDGELQTGTTNIKRTIWGDRYSYNRQPLTRRVNYTFTVDTQKRIELEDFLENFSSQLVDFENHKGERWKAFIVNMPLVHESRGRYMPRNEKFDISLEFEGVKISS